MFLTLTDPRIDRDPCGCWLWTGRLNHDGYGITTHGGKQRRVHRIIYTLVHGPIPKGCQVNHTCHVRHCGNPEHLYAGTQKQNMKDKAVSGRASRLIGSLHPSAKLNLAIAAKIRAEYVDGVPQVELAKKYSVGPTTVHLVVTGKRWV